MIGKTLDRYQVTGVLGAGGMGIVYRAVDTVLCRDVALKVLREGALSEDHLKERFRNEARTLSRLQHPHIASIYDFRTVEGCDFLVMELVQGPSLADRLRQGPLPPYEAVRTFRQILLALAEAHETGIIHRDLKPGNVVIDGKGDVKILDFGLAKLLVADALGDAPMTAEGVVAGTLPYMCPEQLRGEAPCPSVDLYAAGAVFYEMLAGRRPFTETEPGPLIQAILTQPPPPIRGHNALVEPQFERLALKALEKTSARRFQSAQEMLQVLDSTDDVPTLLAHSAVKRLPFWRNPPAAPVLLLLAVFLATALVGIVGLSVDWTGIRHSLAQLRSIPTQPVVAILPLLNVSGNPTLEPLGIGISHSLTTSLSALPTVTMISPNESRAFEPNSAPIGAIASQLGADYVVTGSIQGVGNQLQLSLNLVQRDASVVWGGQVQGSGDDLFALQSELAADLSHALRLILTPQDRARLATPPTSSVDAFADYTQARAFLERPDVPGNLARAETLFQAALEKDARFAMAYAGLGETYWVKYQQTNQREWTEKALDATIDALRLDAEEPSVRYSLALIYEGTGRAADAMAELRQALSLKPNNDDARRLMGKILADSGEVAKAIEEFQEAIRIRPNYWKNYRALGLAYYRSGDLPAAAAAFQRVTQLQPDFPWGFQMLGLVRHAQGDLDSAISNYEKAIELGPSPASFSNLGTILYRRGRFQEAAEKYRAALKLRPSSPTTHGNLGDALRRLGERDSAREAYTEAARLSREMLAVNANDPETLAMLSVYEAKLGHLREAEELANQALSLAPDNADVLYNKTVVQTLANQRDDAVASLRLALNNGYPVHEAAQDDDLRTLRDTPGFTELFQPINHRK